MIFLPLSVVNNHKTNIFPTVALEAFTYQDIYIEKDTLSVGVGYWLKFDSYQRVAIAGGCR